MNVYLSSTMTDGRALAGERRGRRRNNWRLGRGDGGETLAVIRSGGARSRENRCASGWAGFYFFRLVCFV